MPLRGALALALYGDGLMTVTAMSTGTEVAPIRPFCMVSFIGNLRSRVITLRNTMLSGMAVRQFSVSPCHCEGCSMFTEELDRMGGRDG